MIGVGVGICCVVSNNCDGMVATDGRLHCVGAGAIVATIADNLSSFLSKSRNLVGVWPSLRAFAGRLRATCSTHSTLAFWHLGHVSFNVEQKYGWGKQTSGREPACQMERSEPCVFDSARTQRRSLSSLLLRPWRGQNWQSWGKESHRPPAGYPGCSCGEVRSCGAKSGVKLQL